VTGVLLAGTDRRSSRAMAPRPTKPPALLSLGSPDDVESPRLGLEVDHLLELLVDGLALGEQLVQLPP
jgi:hypothetical protein